MWVGAPPSASARREATFAYPLSRVWTAAVRLVRVDLDLPVTEKDKEDGYFFFEYTDHGKKFPGSVELVSVQDSGGDQVRVIVQVPAMPAYVEGMILDRLARKLEQEFGPPKAPAGKPPAKPDDDAAKGDKDLVKAKPAPR
jgi:hypothetical protein